MLTLCIDTTNKYLNVCLIKENVLLASYLNEVSKKHSELVFDAIDEVFKKADIHKSDIDSICIAIGPGSYTGVRIALTISKILASTNKIKLYTVSSLKLISNNTRNSLVMVDARSNRCYCGIYDSQGNTIKEEILENNNIPLNDYYMIGDLHLINLEDNYPDLTACFLNCINYWQEVENIHHLEPIYLKESENYYR